MARVEKTVFISYRRPNLTRALAIYQKLTAHGYDVFFDRGDSQHEDFEQAILDNIKTRAHFLIQLTPSALDGFDSPDDLMRREIETALDEKRNIICLFFEGAGFSAPSIGQYLTGKMAGLKLCPSLNVPADQFDKSMTRLHEKFLNVPVDVRLYSPALPQNVTGQKQVVTSIHATEEKLTAVEWLERGNKYYDDGKPDEAISCFSAAIRLKPDDADFYNNRGLARAAKGDLDGAIGDFTEAIRLKPNYAEAYCNRGNAQQDKGNLNGAIEDFTKAIHAKPNWADPYNNRGYALHLNGDLDGALQDCNEATRLNPDLIMAYNNRGNVRLDQGDTDGAIRDYTLAIEIDPDFYLSYSNRGNAYWSMGNLDSAFQDCARAIHLKPDFAMAHNNQGNVRQDIGDLDGALLDYNEAIRLQPDEFKFYYNRGNALYKKGDLNKAFEDFTETVRLKPDYINAYRNRALIHWTRANYQAVMADLQVCLNLGENDPTIYDALHEAQIRLK